jgi:hypothetical protein
MMNKQELWHYKLEIHRLTREAMGRLDAQELDDKWYSLSQFDFKSRAQKHKTIKRLVECHYHS